MMTVSSFNDLLASWKFGVKSFINRLLCWTKMTSTRSETFCNVFGTPVQLKETVLPTYADLMKHFLSVRNELLWKGNKKDPSVKDISEIVSCDIARIWKKASIPVVSQQEIIRLIRNYNEKYKNVKRIPKSRKGADKVKKDFFDHANSTLFDISACKCLNYEQCKCSVKIPSMERNFLTDQRHERKMAIGSIDVSVSRKLKRIRESQQRREDQEAKAREYKDNVSMTITDLEANAVLGSDSDDIPEDDDDYVSHEAKRLKATDAQIPSTSKTGQMRISLPNLAVACDRAGVSDRSAAVIASSVLQDVGIVSKDTPAKVIDRSKLRRARRKVRSQLESTATQIIQSLDSIYFDGRKDKTIVYEKKGNSSYRTTAVEEHIVLLSEPGSVYIGHVTPDSGSSADITRSITNFVTQKGIALSKLVAVGCDGTNVNTGKKNGVVRRLEIFVGHKLHWFVCLLHTNELPLRHLFQKIDGKTSGPQQFSGTIGKSLETCETLAVTGYVPIPVALPEIDKKNLSTDQKYLLDISRAVSSGECPPDLANRSPGEMAHSRWLTTANRILRLYMSTAEPPDDLKLLAEYVIKVYVPSWFEIQKIPRATHGARHLHGMIKKSSFLPEEFKAIVHEVIQRNSYFALTLKTFCWRCWKMNEHTFENLA